MLEVEQFLHSVASGAVAKDDIDREIAYEYALTLRGFIIQYAINEDKYYHSPCHSRMVSHWQDQYYKQKLFTDALKVYGKIFKHFNIPLPHAQFGPQLITFLENSIFDMAFWSTPRQLYSYTYTTGAEDINPYFSQQENDHLSSLHTFRQFAFAVKFGQKEKVTNGGQSSHNIISQRIVPGTRSNFKILVNEQEAVGLVKPRSELVSDRTLTESNFLKFMLLRWKPNTEELFETEKFPPRQEYKNLLSKLTNYLSPGLVEEFAENLREFEAVVNNKVKEQLDEIEEDLKNCIAEGKQMLPNEHNRGEITKSVEEFKLHCAELQERANFLVKSEYRMQQYISVAAAYLSFKHWREINAAIYLDNAGLLEQWSGILSVAQQSFRDGAPKEEIKMFFQYSTQLDFDELDKVMTNRNSKDKIMKPGEIFRLVGFPRCRMMTNEQDLQFDGDSKEVSKTKIEFPRSYFDFTS